MTAEEERAAIVAWLWGGHFFPWLKRPASILDRFKAAWQIMRYGENVPAGMGKLLAFKIERLDHHASKEGKG